MIRIKSNIKIVVLVMCCFISIASHASENDKVKTAVTVVSELCLSGTEYGINADLQGNITIKNFKPKGSGSVTLNVREVSGATAFQKELRLIADDKVRECTQNHIGRILDAVLESTKQQKAVQKTNNSVRKARYLGYVPEQVSVQSFVEGEDKLYYRFSVKEPSTIKVKFSKNSQQVSMYLLTEKERAIVSNSYRNGGSTQGHFLMPGDYYILVKSTYNNSATAFKMVVEGFPDA